MKVGIIGAGSWGTALACLVASKGYKVDLWVRRKDLCAELVEQRVNADYLPGVCLPSQVYPSSDLEMVVFRKKVIILTVPSKAMRETALRIKPYLSPDTLLVSAAKGLECETMLRMSEVLDQSLFSFKERGAVLSGPNHAEEVSKEIPTATVVAAGRVEVADFVQELLMTPFFRVYTNPDLTGVELGGALKNVVALGVGIVDGLGFGDNAKAALITRGLAEITRLGVAMGARASTFSGLSGVGDLFATCNSNYSRNRYVGLRLGRGEKLAPILKKMKMVAEGVNTTRAVYDLKDRLNVKMPITEQTYKVLFEDKKPQEAVKALMGRTKTREIEDMAFID